MTLLLGALTIGIILSMLALGVFISFRIFDNNGMMFEEEKRIEFKRYRPNKLNLKNISNLRFNDDSNELILEDNLKNNRNHESRNFAKEVLIDSIGEFKDIYKDMI